MSSEIKQTTQEKYRATRAKYYQKHKAEIIEKTTKWYAEHRDEVLAKSKLQRKAFKEWSKLKEEGKI